MIYIGIDTLATHRPFCYVALDKDLKAQAIGQGRLEEALAFVSGQAAARVAVNAPHRPNQGVITREGIQPSLIPDLPPDQQTNLRKAEYELFQRGMRVPRTPARAEDCPLWMRRGFSFYGFLDQLGYCGYPDPGDLQYLETQAEACFWTLIERQPYPASSLEGRLQRQMVLYKEGLHVLDPMMFLEEVTPRKLFQGTLPLEKIFGPYELNAWMAAYIAWLGDHHPERLAALGAPEEGLLLVPERPAVPSA